MKVIEIENRKFADPSVIKLIKQNGGDAPERIIQEKAQKLLAFMKKHNLWNAPPPPFDPKQIAICHGIDVVESDQIWGDDANLVTLPNGLFEIRYNPNGNSVGRQNFSIAHEIVHTFFPDCAEVTRTRKRHSKRSIMVNEDDLEYFCDFGASNILMPEDVFQRYLAKVPISLNGILSLRESFCVSLDAAAIRTVKLCKQQCAVIFFEYCYKPKEEEFIAQQKNQLSLLGDEWDVVIPKKYRIQYAVCNEYLKCYFPKHKSVDQDSVIYKCTQDSGILTAYERWNWVKKDIPWFIETTIAPIPGEAGPPRVLAFVRPKTPM